MQLCQQKNATIDIATAVPEGGVPTLTKKTL